jgi:hypothetical protein
MRFSARVTPDGGHPAVIKAMSDNAYADMQEEIGVELIKAGFSAVITSRLIEDRGQKTDADGNELPVGVFISDIAFVDTISEEEFFEHINQMMRGVAIAQALIRRHVRLADPSGAPSDQATAPALDVVTDSTAATATEGGDQVPDVETS